MAEMCWRCIEGITNYPISLVDARKLKNAMIDVVAKQLVAASQLLIQDVMFWSHGSTVSVSVERWKYIAWRVQREGKRFYTLKVSIT